MMMWITIVKASSVAQDDLRWSVGGPSDLQRALAASEAELVELRHQLAAAQIERNLEVDALTDERDGLDAALEVPPPHPHHRTPT